ncbi:VanZ family protein [Cellulosilyticum sp. WCF-2]|uniref:VanZ family protein n=1 Tax=Cellulosilyticum sp. WCF-2 TaxID=2497860 RepID=UPI000F8D00CE|nr:VanZ family protein [Cellulosilyticum sp. WCF-2]QEH67767.1 VanZ family protein [Cellulosilyticum sp. WCF-2]
MAIDEIIRYVYVTFIVATLFFIPIMFIRGMYLRRKGRWPIKNWKKEIAVILFIFYLLCLYQITALRFGGIGWDISNMMARNTRVNMTPMVELWNWTVKGVWWHLFYNVIGNFIWFVPLGALVPALFISQRKPGRVMLIGAIVSASIEILQYILCTGVTDIDDVILNTIGAGIGYIVFKILYGIYKFLRGKLSKKKQV